MFTGLIEEIGTVRHIDRSHISAQLSVACRKIMPGTASGDSVAVNGICLTVTQAASDGFTADVMPETMRMSNLGKLRVSDSVNLERALTLSGRLGGHLVSGHVDGTGILTDKWEEDFATWLSVSAPPSVMKYIVRKGSVALDGTSLTVARVRENGFDVSLIPLTRQLTILPSLRPGDVVNIECDMIAKYTEKLYRMSIGRNASDTDMSSVQDGPDPVGGHLTEEFLRDNGF